MRKKAIELEDIPGVGAKIAEKLREIGYTDPMVIAVTAPSELAAIAEIGEGQATKIIKAVREMLEIGYETADKILERRTSVARITTGSKNLDNLLGGGIESLPPDERVLIINEGELKQVEIGKIVDESVALGALKNGITEVSNINLRNAYSLSFDDNFRIKPIKITAFVRHRLLGNIYEIKLGRGKKIRVTEDHSIFVFRNGKILPIPVTELEQNDFLVVPKKIVIDKNIEKLNLLSSVLTLDDTLLKKLYIKDREFNEYIFTNYKSKLINVLRRLGYKERKFWDWRYENRLPIHVLKYLGIDSKILEKFKPKFGSKDLINSVVKLDEGLCWLLGFMLAECGTILNYPYLGLCQEKSRLHLLKKAQRLFKEIFDIDVPIFPQKRRNSYQYVLTTANRAIWTVFKALGFVSHSFNKSIPASIFGLTSEKICAFLRGYFDGDKELKRGTVGWCTSSEKLANDLCLLLLRLGEIPVLGHREDKRKETYKGIYYVFAFKLKDINILGKEVEKRHEFDVFPCRDVILQLLKEHKLTNRLNYFYNLVYQGQPTVKTVRAFINEFKRLAGEAEEIVNLEKILDSDLRFEKIVKIEATEEKPEYVYDLQVLNKPLIDNFIAGNFIFAHNTQAITETYAQYGGGKSQLGFTLAVNVQLPQDRGGLDGNCLFIDSENTFRPERIVQIAKPLGLAPEKVLRNIFVARSFNSEHQMLLVEKAPEVIEDKKIKLIVIDSLTSHFRADFFGRGELAARQQKLNRHLHQLQRLADAFNLAVYVTNQVMADPSVLFGDPIRAVGGNVLGHMATYRLYLRKGREGTRICRVVDSPSHAEGEAVFRITSEGIKDP